MKKNMTQTKTTFIDLDNARVDEQRRVMEKIREADHCPFCLGNLRAYHKEPFIKEGQFWILTKNQWPYVHTSVHLLFIYKQHVEKLTGIAPEAGTELIQLSQWAESEYKMPGGGLAMRFGDTDYSAGTVAHLHAQLLVPDIAALDYDDDPVKVTIGKTWKKRGAK